jgi:sec-independent protein translocase protein TatB
MEKRWAAENARIMAEHPVATPSTPDPGGLPETEDDHPPAMVERPVMVDAPKVEAAPADHPAPPREGAPS